jgi:hypothetical protein
MSGDWSSDYSADFGGSAGVAAAGSQPILFSQAAQAMLAGEVVRLALGVRLDFADGTMRVWCGQGQHVAGDGTIWQGLGSLASIEGLEASSNMQTESITMTLSGLDISQNAPNGMGPSLLKLARQETAMIRGRTCAVYALLRGANEQPLDTPYIVGVYLMDSAPLVVDAEARSMSIPLTAEPLFATKHLPPIALVTNEDQQAAFPGDRIFERIALLTGRQTVIWNS